MDESARDLLDAAYRGLGYSNGSLLSACTSPDASTSAHWVGKGDWLVLAKKIHAEKVFFVNDYPVIVFAEQTSDDPSAWMHHFNSSWCMARPQLLFLARRGELAVLNLTSKPAREGEPRDADGRVLDLVYAAADVQSHLAKYRREQVESGRLFEGQAFGLTDRADRALVRDLGRIRTALIADGMSAGHAHALIGRSIFVRYLEDRGVLTEEYFRKIAARAPLRVRAAWMSTLDADVETAAATGAGSAIYYPRVLKNKLFTYTLFRSLADNFNGDMFPLDDEEELAVTERHLCNLRRFLLGNSEQGLFFYAYRFDIIPIELISSIYEKFYSTRPDQQRDDGSYYTSPALVEFVLSEVLTDEQLSRNPRVLDPACGSGIFLVESFRRIVRYRCQSEGRDRPTPDELRAVIRDQIRGIDINREAIRVAAFSLYLALLHYLTPPDILQNLLPSLTYRNRPRRDLRRHFDMLLVSDAFSVETSLVGSAAIKRFGPGSADIVLGNPPWGSPKPDETESLRSDGGISWCNARNLSVGDRERSQAFIHRSLEFLAPGGRAGLLLSTGVFFKRHANTRLFREQWLSQVTLRTVVNFAAVRDAYFRTDDAESGEGRGAIAPFAAAIFDNLVPSADSAFDYWSAKETAFVRHVQAVILNRADLRRISQERVRRDDTLWKIYWWGSHRDEALVQRLRLEQTLGQVFDPNGDNIHIGFLEAKKDQKPSGWLRRYPEFPTGDFERYGPLPKSSFRTPPPKVKRRSEESLYRGSRILVKRGVGADGPRQGQIVARFETERFSFRHSVWCISVPPRRALDAKVVLGILWSSVTRYYLFMTSGTWGLWHDEVLRETLAALPVRLSMHPELRDRIVSIVDRLRRVSPEGKLPFDVNRDRIANSKPDPTIPGRDGDSISALEAKLDAAVFELFDFSQAESELVQEFCLLGLDLFYQGMESCAVKPVDWPDSAPRVGRAGDAAGDMLGELGAYIKTFLDLWEPPLRAQGGRLRWQVVTPHTSSALMGIVFETEAVDEPLPYPRENETAEWSTLFSRLEHDSRHPLTARVYIDGLLRIVTDTDIVLVKRNERRLWTIAAAREDVEATMALTIMRQKASDEGSRN